MCASYTCGSSRGTVTTGGRYCATCNLGTIFRGQTLDVGTVGLTGASLLQGRAMLWLQDAAGNVVASNQGYQNTWNAYITYTATSSGTYTLYEGIPNFSARSPTGTQGYDTVTSSTVRAPAARATNACSSAAETGCATPLSADRSTRDHSAGCATVARQPRATSAQRSRESTGTSEKISSSTGCGSCGKAHARCSVASATRALRRGGMAGDCLNAVVKQERSVRAKGVLGAAAC